jgi:hypothetical protein
VNKGCRLTSSTIAVDMRIRLSLLCFVTAVAAGSLPRRTAAESPTPPISEIIHSSTSAPLPKHFSFIPDCARDCVNQNLPQLWKDPQTACKDWTGKGDDNAGIDAAKTSSQKVKTQIDGCVKEMCPRMGTASYSAGLRDACVFPSTTSSSTSASKTASKSKTASRSASSHHHSSTSTILSTTPPHGIALTSAVKDTKESKGSKTLSGGVLAAVIITPIVFLLLVGAVMWLLRRRFINNRNQPRSMPFDYPPPQKPVPLPSNAGWTALDSQHASYASDGSWGMLEEHRHSPEDRIPSRAMSNVPNDYHHLENRIPSRAMSNAPSDYHHLENRIPSRAMSNAPSDYHHLENDPPPHPSAGDIRSNYANNNSFLRPPSPVSPDLGYVGMAREPSSSSTDVMSPVSPMSSFRLGGSNSMRHASISTMGSVATPRPPAPGGEPIGIARADSVSWRREVEHAAGRAASRVVELEQQRVGKDKSKSTRNVGETGREEWPLFGKRGSWGSRKSAASAEREII